MNNWQPKTRPRAEVRSMKYHWLVTSAILLMSFWLTGCGSDQPPAYSASGRVVFANGTPVKSGSVELKSRDHKVQARGTIETDGSFVLSTYRPGDGAVSGVHDCVVVQMFMGEDIQRRTHGIYGVVHPRFASYHSAKLTCTIEPKPDNVLTLTVEGVGKLTEGGSEKDHRK
jgi:hypothetical protein